MDGRKDSREYRVVSILTRKPTYACVGEAIHQQILPARRVRDFGGRRRRAAAL